jgi:ATP-dependent helicase HrpA
VSTRHFDRWWKQQQRTQPDALRITAEALLGDVAAPGVTDDFPDSWHYDGIDLALTYRYEPGAPDDGTTVHVPLTVLNRVGDEGFDWSVPGFREELVAALCRTLPKELRRAMVPAAETVAAACGRIDPADGRLVVSLARVLTEMLGERVTASMFDGARIPDHLRITFSVDDASGRSLGTGKDIHALRRALEGRMRAAIAAAAPLAERSGIIAWDLGTLPRQVETVGDGHSVFGYPALLDDGDSVSLRIFTTPAMQTRVMRAGVRRLLLLAVNVTRKQVVQGLTNSQRLAIARSERVELDEIADQCITSAADLVVSEFVERHGDLPFDAGRIRLRESIQVRQNLFTGVLNRHDFWRGASSWPIVQLRDWTPTRTRVTDRRMMPEHVARISAINDGKPCPIPVPKIGVLARKHR